MSAPKLRAVVAIDDDGARVWTCDDCGHHGLWGDGWLWYGTIDHVETVLCPRCAPIGVEVLDAEDQS